MPQQASSTAKNLPPRAMVILPVKKTMQAAQTAGNKRMANTLSPSKNLVTKPIKAIKGGVSLKPQAK